MTCLCITHGPSTGLYRPLCHPWSVPAYTRLLYHPWSQQWSTRPLYHSWSQYWSLQAAVSLMVPVLISIGDCVPMVTEQTSTRLLYHPWSQFRSLPGLCITDSPSTGLYRPRCHPWSQYRHLPGFRITHVHNTVLHQASVSRMVTVLAITCQ